MDLPCSGHASKLPGILSFRIYLAGQVFLQKNCSPGLGKNL